MILIEEIKKIAELARLEITDKETEDIRSEIEDILKYVGEIGKVDLTGAEDKILTNPYNVFREDLSPHEGGIYSEDIISEAPLSENGWIKVKKIIEE